MNFNTWHSVNNIVCVVWVTVSCLCSPIYISISSVRSPLSSVTLPLPLEGGRTYIHTTLHAWVSSTLILLCYATRCAFATITWPSVILNTKSYWNTVVSWAWTCIHGWQFFEGITFPSFIYKGKCPPVPCGDYTLVWMDGLYWIFGYVGMNKTFNMANNCTYRFLKK